MKVYALSVAGERGMSQDFFLFHIKKLYISLIQRKTFLHIPFPYMHNRRFQKKNRALKMPVKVIQ